MKEDRCLSDYWRLDASDDRVLELVSVLRGADTLIGVMGSELRGSHGRDRRSHTPTSSAASWPWTTGL